MTTPEPPRSPQSPSSPQPPQASQSSGSEGDHEPTVEELEAQIEQTRMDLGDTVEALSAKLDVKSRVKSGAGDVAHRGKEQIDVVRSRASAVLTQARDAALDERGRPQPPVLAGVAGVLILATAVVVVVVRRRR